MTVLKNANRHLFPSRCFISHICFSDTNQQKHGWPCRSFFHSRFRVSAYEISNRSFARIPSYFLIICLFVSWRPPWGVGRAKLTVIWSLGWQTVTVSLKPVYIKLLFFCWKKISVFFFKIVGKRPCAQQWISFYGGAGESMYEHFIRVRY